MSRKLIVLAAVIGCLFCSLPFATAQPMILPPRAQIIIRDNGEGIDTLTFGNDICATRCIDALLGERELPPAPPTGDFDVRWTDPAAQNECMGQGLRLNLQYWSSLWTTDTFKIQFQPGDGGFPMRFSWPADLNTMFSSLALRDPLGIGIISVDMLTNTSYTLTNSSFTSLLIFARVLPNEFHPCDPIDVREVNDHLPAEFDLRQNYPNPFNPSTTIEFDVQERAFVGIEVFDILGTLVKHLVSRDLSPATYSATWNGTDNSGNAVASGVYYVRMRATSSHAGSNADLFISTRKVLLAR